MNKKLIKVPVIAVCILALIALLLLIFRLTYRDAYSIDTSKAEILTVTSGAFADNETIPIRYTGRGEDISPELKLSALLENAKTIAIVMDDLDHPPVIGNFNHWVIWNIPAQEIIPEGIPHGEVVEFLGNAVQGNAFGKHRYRGPRPPSGFTHRYRFSIYVLDCQLDLDSDSDKKDLLESMDGHVIQYGYLIGTFE